MADPSSPIERVRRLLADHHGCRIIDVEDDDVRTFMRDLTKHGLVLVPSEAVIR